jgi:formate hydrogenlyase subunit 4
VTFWSSLVRGLFYPGFVSALLVGVICRGAASWLGAHWGRRPAAPAWQPGLTLLQLARRVPVYGAGHPPPLVIWFGLVGLVSLVWATGVLPWPRGFLAPQEAFPATLVLYLLLLAVPPLARLVAAGLSDQPTAALGARRQAPLEIARLLPLTLATAAIPLASHQLGLAQTLPLDPAHAVLSLTVAGILLATLPWPQWDHDAHEAPLAALGGRPLALFRALEAMELSAQTGLIGAVLQGGGLLPAEWQGLAPLIALLATVIALAAFERSQRRPPLTAAVHRYTRWLLPLATAAAVLGWAIGRSL